MLLEICGSHFHDKTKHWKKFANDSRHFCVVVVRVRCLHTKVATYDALRQTRLSKL